MLLLCPLLCLMRQTHRLRVACSSCTYKPAYSGTYLPKTILAQIHEAPEEEPGADGGAVKQEAAPESAKVSACGVSCGLP